MYNNKVSILIPFKDTAIYLPECLDSILNQSYKNWEAILVNDNSKDKSFDIVKKYTKIDSRIKLIQNQGDGIIDALQTAYQFSNGIYITRMDSDDIMMTNKIEVMVQMLISNGLGHISLGLVKYFSKKGIKNGYKRYEKWLNGLILKGKCFDEIYKECVIPSPCWMINRNDLDKAKGFNSKIYPEDYDLSFRFYKSGMKCIPANKVLHLWRDHSLRTSRNSDNYSNNSFLDLKVFYFLKLSYNKSIKLFLWGAGQKGKKVAFLLTKAKIKFTWICNNPKKIGKKIYGNKLESWLTINKYTKYQSIITIANQNSQNEIKKYLKLNNKVAMKDYFFFC